MPNRRQAIIWTKYGLIYWSKYASLGLNELTTTKHDKTGRTVCQRKVKVDLGRKHLGYISSARLQSRVNTTKVHVYVHNTLCVYVSDVNIVLKLWFPALVDKEQTEGGKNWLRRRR